MLPPLWWQIFCPARPEPWERSKYITVLIAEKSYFLYLKRRMEKYFMETKEMYFKRQHIIRELLELLQVDENAGEKEKIAAVQETTLFYIYYVLILDESHTNFDRIKKINARSTNPLDKLRIENSKKEVDLYDAYCNCLKGIDVLYEAILSDEVEEGRKRDYDKLAKSFFEKMDELSCYVLKNWKIIK